MISVLCLLLSFGCAKSGTERTAESAKGTKEAKGAIPAGADTIGAQAPEFELADISGKKVRLSDFKGRVVIVDFWATWCGPCLHEIPDFVRLQSKYRKEGLVILGVTVNSGEKAVRSVADDHDINYPVLLDGDETTKLFGGIYAIPTTFVLDRQGRIAKKFIGAMPPEAFEEVIQPLLAT